MSLIRAIGRLRGFLFVVVVDVLVVITASLIPSVTVVLTSLISGVEIVSIVGVLLAITFASYSFLFTIIPYLKRAIIETKAMEYLGTLFLLTIYLEMVTLGFGVVTQVLVHDSHRYSLFLEGYSFLFLLSVSSIALLSYYLHLLFNQARKTITGKIE